MHSLAQSQRRRESARRADPLPFKHLKSESLLTDGQNSNFENSGAVNLNRSLTYLQMIDLVSKQTRQAGQNPTRTKVVLGVSAAQDACEALAEVWQFEFALRGKTEKFSDSNSLSSKSNSF